MRKRCVPGPFSSAKGQGTRLMFIATVVGVAEMHTELTSCKLATQSFSRPCACADVLHMYM